MGRHSGFDDLAPPGGMTEHLDGLLHPPTTGPAPIQDLSSVLRDQADHFQLDLDQAPKAIAAFREAAQGLRDLMDVADQLTEVRPPGLDAVSINAAKEIGLWAASTAPGSLRAALESGAMQLEQVADALERSLTVHRNNDETSAAQLSRTVL